MQKMPEILFVEMKSWKLFTVYCLDFLQKLHNIEDVSGL